jgi:Lon protease-like protein
LTLTSNPSPTGPIHAAALEALPIFPLPGVVLLPGATMPLHVFEPRYRAMLADCLATHRVMALALVQPGEGDERGESEGLPRIARVAGAGSIVEHTALPDGRSNIVIRGVARVALRELPFSPPYRRAHARVLESVATPVAPADYAALRGAALGFASAARRLDRNVEFLLPPDLDAGSAADLCAHHLILEAAARQRTLEELDVAARVRFVVATLADQTARLKRDRSKLD